MENVEIKGTKKKVVKTETKIMESPKVIVREEEQDLDRPLLSKVEAKRTKPDAYLKSLINKMTKEQKETAIIFMSQRNEARLRANMEPAYTQSDMDLYK